MTEWRYLAENRDMAKRSRKSPKQLKTKPKKDKGGRPTAYKSDYPKIAEELCEKKGYTNENLAAHFKVAVDTIYEWKKKYSEFSEAIKKGKDIFNIEVVEQCLLKRVTGFSYDEVTKEPVIINKGEIADEDVEKGETPAEAAERTLVITKVVTKKVAGDVTAQIFFLKNRSPKRWSDLKEIEHRIPGLKATLTLGEMKLRIEQAAKAGTGIDMKSIEGGG